MPVLNSATDIEGPIQMHLQVFWVDIASNPLTDIAWPLLGYVRDPTRPYLQVTIMPGNTVLATAGPVGLNECTGIVQFDIFTPKGQGAGLANSLSDKVRSLFNGITLDPLRFFSPSLPKIGYDAAMARRIVDVAFWVFESRGS